MSEREGLRVAHDLAAGRVVRALATAIGDSIHLDVRLSDAVDGGRLISRISTRLPASAGVPHYALLADSLLFGQVTWDGESAVDVGTASAAARRAYGAGRLALEQWDLADADSLLSAALEHDRTFARAHLWLAQLRNLAGDETDGWRASAAQAVRDTAHLTSREKLIATALSHLGRREFVEACAASERVIARDERDFFGWFGLGQCRRSDGLVVRDASSPSGWRFRGSAHAGVQAYASALTLAPGSSRAYRDSGFERLRDLFFTLPNDFKQGASTEGMMFAARPEWRDDSLAFVPRPWLRGQSLPLRDATLHQEALRQQRLLFYRIARGWALAHPNSADALYALAVSQEILVDAIAVETLSRARQNARDDETRRQLATHSVWLLFKFSSGDESRLTQARILADSLLRAYEEGDSRSDGDAAALAVLLGRPAQAANFARRAEPGIDEVYGLTAAVLRPGAALLAFAAVGAPNDSIAELEADLLAILSHAVSAEHEASARHQLQRPALLAATAYPMRILARPRELQDPNVSAWALLVAGDSAAARRVASEMRSRWSGSVPPGRLTPDALYSQAALHAALGDTSTAIAWLDPTLTQLEWVQPGVLDDYGNVGALIRSMALRAELADRTGDAASARRWASAVVALWSTGEPATRPLLTRMRAIRARHTQP